MRRSASHQISDDVIRPVQVGNPDAAGPRAFGAERAADVPGDASTNVTLGLNKTYYGSLETVGDHDWMKVELGVGTYQIRVHGVGTTELNDPLLSVYDGNSNFLGTVDDYEGDGWGGGNQQDPFAILTVTTAGTFFIDVSSFVGGSTNDDTGDYIVTVSPGASGEQPIHTIDEIAWQLTNNFWENPNGPNQPQALAFNVGADGKLTYNINALTATGKALATAALEQWSDVTGIQFVATGGAAELTFDDSDAGVNAYAGPNQINGSTILSSSIMITTGWLNQFGGDFSSYSFETYIHEIGHALGLGHGGNYNGTIDDNYYSNDSLMYSIMSYSQVDNDEFTQGQPGNNPTIDASFRYMQTVAIADVVAIQNLYGDDTATREGNTKYGYGANTGNDALDAATDLGADMFFLVYDDGGKDTLDFSRYRGGQRIDLNAEASSDVLGGRQNVWIARGVTVENAIGGKKADVITGNDVANDLSGGRGGDRLSGGRGNDTLDGGAGDDVLVFEKRGGRDVVEHFEDGDRLHLKQFGFDSIDDVRDVATQSGDDLLLDLGSKTFVRLEDFLLSDLGANDVIL